MSGRSEDTTWGQVLFLLAVAIVLVFTVVTCRNTKRDACRESGGSPLDQGRGTGISCFYTDGRPPAQFDMEK